MLDHNISTSAEKSVILLLKSSVFIIKCIRFNSTTKPGTSKDDICFIMYEILDT